VRPLIAAAAAALLLAAGCAATKSADAVTVESAEKRLANQARAVAALSQENEKLRREVSELKKENERLRKLTAGPPEKKKAPRLPPTEKK
jgi:predicted RNase H-like nuclease (RuvC/YqgF family)